MSIVLQLELHGILHIAMKEIKASRLAPRHDKEGAVVTSEHDNLTNLYRLCIFPSDVADLDLVIH